MKTKQLILSIVTALAAETVALPQNIIDQTYGTGAGSFELGFFDDGNEPPLNRPGFMLVFPDMTNIVGWSVGGANGVHWTGPSVQNTTDGDRTVDLQGLFAPPVSSLSTTIPTVPGAPYSLSFDASPGNIVNRAVVSCGSLTDQPFSGVANPLGQPSVFTNYIFRFTALASSTTILFQVDDSDGYGPVIDNVSVESLAPHLTIRVSEVELCWDTVTNAWYQLQYRSALTTNIWTPLMPGWVAGTEATQCTNDAILVGQSQRFYQVAVTNSPPQP